MGLQAARKDFVAYDSTVLSPGEPPDNIMSHAADHAEAVRRLDPLISALAKAVERFGAARSTERNSGIAR